MTRGHPVDTVTLEQRAAAFERRSMKGDGKVRTLEAAIGLLDLTTLEGADSPERVRALCRKAVAPGRRADGSPLPPVAAVCVYPSLVAIARTALAGSSVRVASVATAFPSGQSPIDVRLADVASALANGADEIDVVINRGAFLAGRHDEVVEEIRQFRRMTARSAALKVILETGELGTYDAIRRACDLVIEAVSSLPTGARAPVAFLKTSTGKVSPAATMPATLVLLHAIRDHARATGVRLGIKPAGGIRTAKQAIHYIVMVAETLGAEWLDPELFRIGASSLLDDLVRQLGKQDDGRYRARYDVAAG